MRHDTLPPLPPDVQFQRVPTPPETPITPPDEDDVIELSGNELLEIEPDVVEAKPERKGPPPLPQQLKKNPIYELSDALKIEEARQAAHKQADQNEDELYLPDNYVDNFYFLGTEFQIKLNPDGTLPKGGFLGLFDKNKKRFESLLKTNTDFKARYETLKKNYDKKLDDAYVKKPTRTLAPPDRKGVPLVAGAVIAGAVAGKYIENHIENHGKPERDKNIAEGTRILESADQPSSVLDSPNLVFKSIPTEWDLQSRISAEAFPDLNTGDKVPAKFLTALESLKPGDIKVLQKLNTSTTVDAYKSPNGNSYITVSFEGSPQRVFKVENGVITDLSKGEAIEAKIGQKIERTPNVSESSLKATLNEQPSPTNQIQPEAPKKARSLKAKTISTVEDAHREENQIRKEQLNDEDEPTSQAEKKAKTSKQQKAETDKDTLNKKILAEAAAKKVEFKPGKIEVKPLPEPVQLKFEPLDGSIYESVLRALAKKENFTLTAKSPKNFVKAETLLKEYIKQGKVSVTLDGAPPRFSKDILKTLKNAHGKEVIVTLK